MMVALACLAFVAGDPYAALGARIPAREWQALQTYIAQSSREPLEGNPPLQTPSFIPAGSTPLAAKRLAAEGLTSIVDGLHALAEAPDGSGFERTAEDLAKIKDLARLALFVAEVRFAAGERPSAVGVLLDGLTMARRVGRGSTMDRLVGIACESMVEYGFAENLAQIPLADCTRVQAAADAILADPAVPPKDATPEMREAFSLPESLWVAASADPLLTAQAKERTQARLLRLHMRIEAYRWRNLKMPESLATVAPDSEIVDPLTAKPFRYERTKTTYRLYSDGFPSQGPMELRYRRDPDYRPPSGGSVAP